MKVNYQKIQIIHTCNDNCRFCYDKGDHMYGRASDWDFSKKDIMEKIRTSYIPGEKNYMIFTGGEASMEKHIAMYVAEAKKVGYEKIELITNGVRFADIKFCETMLSAGLTGLNMSIHGHNSQIHDFLTRHPGAFKKILAGLINLRRLNKDFEVSVYIVINNINLAYIRQIIDLLRKFNIKKFDLLQLIPFGNAISNKYLFIDDKNKLQQTLLAIFSKYKNEDIILGGSHLINPMVYEGFEDKMVDNTSLMSDIDKSLGRDWKLDFQSELFVRCQGGIFCNNCYLNEYCSQMETRNTSINVDKNIEPQYLEEVISELPDKYEAFQKTIQNISKNQVVTNIPTCISERSAFFDNYRFYKEKKAMEGDFSSYNDWFFNHGYLTKSSRCESCSLNKKCKGAPISVVKKYGFKVLIPQ